jgi:hypothetical protein
MLYLNIPVMKNVWRSRVKMLAFLAGTGLGIFSIACGGQTDESDLDPAQNDKSDAVFSNLCQAPGALCEQSDQGAIDAPCWCVADNGPVEGQIIDQSQLAENSTICRTPSSICIIEQKAQSGSPCWCIEANGPVKGQAAACVSGIISGKVTDSSGKPLEWVTVSAGGQSDFTDVLGNFRLMGVACGSQVMKAEKDGAVTEKEVTVGLKVSEDIVLQ